MKSLSLVAASVSLGIFIACGGGGGTPPAPPPGPTGLSAGTHTLGLSISVPSDVNVPVSGIALTLRFPQGTSVTTNGGDPGQIISSALSAGSALTGSPVLSGTYSPSTRTARLVAATTPTTTWNGEYIQLKFTVQSGTTVTESDILTLNTSPADYKVAGFDTAAHSTVVLTSRIPTALKVVN